MLSLIFIGLITGVFIIRYIYRKVIRRKDCYDDCELMFSWILGFVCWAMILGLSFFFLTMSNQDAPTRWVRTGAYDLASLERGSQLSGVFFLGCGGVSGKMYYYFYEGRQGGGYVFRQMPVGKHTIIYEEDRINGMHEVFVLKPEDENIWGWKLPYVDDFRIEHRFHIPLGSIKRNWEP